MTGYCNSPPPRLGALISQILSDKDCAAPVPTLSLPDFLLENALPLMAVFPAEKTRPNQLIGKIKVILFATDALCTHQEFVNLCVCSRMPSSTTSVYRLSKQETQRENS